MAVVNALEAEAAVGAEAAIRGIHQKTKVEAGAGVRTTVGVTAAVMDAAEAGAGVRTTVGVTAAVMDAAEAGAGVVQTVLIDMIDMIDKEKSIERTQGV